ncbi:glycine cleavage system protein GcvH [Mycobacterium sp. KBS0706]|uniref:glycine cleavage system protein GcvH n=1 Tax=Mycobacterium sp. KBS0706 TaxID=2578109 RepID=UPI00110FCDCD|nr:glycine cleavage system protein GcvH [Mycobacterium sp. KBS0706]TSD83449.1 glycine cleavage system protein GcvH [Mycobacterium sp. KBS0706]
MSNIPSDLKYSEDHEWVRVESDGSATVGITDHAQKTLGDIVFVEMPEVGKKPQAGDPVGVVESVKAASEIFTPVGGEITAFNEDVSDSPELVNEDPYGDGWIYKIKLSNKSDLDKLLSPDAYAKLIAE